MSEWKRICEHGVHAAQRCYLCVAENATSLRDQFAIAAIIGGYFFPSEGETVRTKEDAAKLAYGMADALLKARTK